MLFQDQSILLEMYHDKGELRFHCSDAGKGRPHHASIPQWHFDMVLDSYRNNAYECAIKRAIEVQQAGGQDCIKVLDIGAGCGMLSLMAARQVTIYIYYLKDTKYRSPCKVIHDI